MVECVGRAEEFWGMSGDTGARGRIGTGRFRD